MKLETFYWLLQRVTAVFLLSIFLFWMVYLLLADGPVVVSSLPIMYPMSTCFAVVLFLSHGFLGIKTIIEDYISSVIKRRILEVFIFLFLIITFLVAFFMLSLVAITSSGYI